MQYLLPFILITMTYPVFSAEQDKDENIHTKLKKSVQITENYVHNWIKFPAVIGSPIHSATPAAIEPRKGRAMAVWTLSVSSVKSQNILPSLIRLQKKFEALFTDFVYVFVNDLPNDVRNFAQEWQLEGRILVGEDEFKKAFKYRQPPTVYLADRFGWLNWVVFDLDEKSLADVERHLEKLNVM